MKKLVFPAIKIDSLNLSHSPHSLVFPHPTVFPSILSPIPLILIFSFHSYTYNLLLLIPPWAPLALTFPDSPLCS